LVPKSPGAVVGSLDPRLLAALQQDWRILVDDVRDKASRIKQGLRPYESVSSGTVMLGQLSTLDNLSVLQLVRNVRAVQRHMHMLYGFGVWFNIYLAFLSRMRPVPGSTDVDGPSFTLDQDSPIQVLEAVGGFTRDWNMAKLMHSLGIPYHYVNRSVSDQFLWHIFEEKMTEVAPQDFDTVRGPSFTEPVDLDGPVTRPYNYANGGMGDEWDPNDDGVSQRRPRGSSTDDSGGDQYMGGIDDGGIDDGSGINHGGDYNSGRNNDMGGNKGKSKAGKTESQPAPLLPLRRTRSLAFAPDESPPVKPVWPRNGYEAITININGLDEPAPVPEWYPKLPDWAKDALAKVDISNDRFMSICDLREAWRVPPLWYKDLRQLYTIPCTWLFLGGKEQNRNTMFCIWANGRKALFARLAHLSNRLPRLRPAEHKYWLTGQCRPEVMQRRTAMRANL
jgi:hypothetical protein